MRKLLTAISFASLTLAGIGIATAQSDVRISEAQVADIRIEFPVYQFGEPDDTLINRPDCQGGATNFEWPYTRG